MMTSNVENSDNKTGADNSVGMPVLTQFKATKTVNNNQLLPPTRYSINLMWLNRTLNEQQEYILPPTCSHGSTIDDCLFEVLAWKQSNPEAMVNLWFDSQYVTQQAITNTQQKLQSMGSNGILLRDIRDIPIVRNNPDTFSDNLPIYFRVDLMKFIICLHSIESDKNESAIFSDFLVGSIRKDGLKKMTREELFSPEMLIDLEKFGIKVGSDAMDKLENQFFQVMNSPKVLDVLKFVINICINTAVTTQKFKGRSDDTSYNIRVTSLSNLVYNQLFKPMFLRLCQEGLGELTVGGELFDPMLHGYNLFGNTVYGERFCIANLGEKSIVWSYTNGKTNLSRIIYRDDSATPGKPLGREVYAEKIGDQHTCEFSTLIQREPADGSGQFKCTLIPIEVDVEKSRKQAFNNK